MLSDDRSDIHIHVIGLISIIILNRDKISYLKKCINSIIGKSTYKNYEILIVFLKWLRTYYCELLYA